jgi:hypothetical protein
MVHIRDNAELAVRNLLREVAKRQGTNRLHAIDYLDDGTAIELTVTIDPDEGSAVFDVCGRLSCCPRPLIVDSQFEGTGAEMIGNLVRWKISLMTWSWLKVGRRTHPSASPRAPLSTACGVWSTWTFRSYARPPSD